MDCLKAESPSGSQLGRVVEAMRDIGRPVTRTELANYGRGLQGMRAAVGDALETLERRHVVRSFERVERFKSGATTMCVRRYYEVVEKRRGIEETANGR